MVSFYDGKWRCQVGVLRDEDYVPVENERTFAYYVQNVRQNMLQSSSGGMRNEKGATQNPKPFKLLDYSWTCGNKLYQRKSTSNLGMGVPTTAAQSEEIPNDGCVKWASGAFRTNQLTWVILRKIYLTGETIGKWHILANQEEDVWDDADIVIAQIEGTTGSASGYLIAQVLKSDVLGIGGTSAVKHPFMVKAISGKHEVSVFTGSVCNVVATYADGSPLSGGPSASPTPAGSLVVPSSGSFQVYLKIASTQTIFPQTVTVEAAASVPAETLDVAYIAITSGYSTTIDSVKRVSLNSVPFVSTSLWADRMRLPNYSSNYFWRV